jgi:futalosine hydrolase
LALHRAVNSLIKTQTDFPVEKMPHHILITSAINPELEYISNSMKQVSRRCIGNRKIIEGILGNHNIRLLESGPGMVNTIQAITAAVENSKPSMIIQTGCAGAFPESGLSLGDIGVAGEEVDIHLGIEPASPYDAVVELPFPVAIQDGIELKNRYQCDQLLTDCAVQSLVRKFKDQETRVKKGPFVTVSTITSTDQKAASLFHHYSAIMENMEGSGAAHLCIHYDIPFLEIRAASNMVGKRDRSGWDLPLACRRSNEAVMAFLDSWDLSVI